MSSPPPAKKTRTAAQFGMPSFNEVIYGPKPPSRFQALPSSPKRKLDCMELEEDDLSQFKRVRLISKEKRKTAEPFSSFPAGGSAFDAAQRQKQEEQTAWDELHTLQSSLGSTHPDTLTYIYSFTRSLRNWGKYQTAEMIIRDALIAGESEMLAQRPEVLQLMLTGLLTVLIDQQKIQEAELLWGTSIEMFHANVGEESANMLKNHFQGVHAFRDPSTELQTLMSDAIDPISLDFPSVTQNMSTFAPAQGFRKHWTAAAPKPQHRDRGWNGPNEDHIEKKDKPTAHPEVGMVRETSFERSASPTLLPPAEVRYT